ncbi:sigma-70 family RNA polymerase sigma factor [Aminipila butyrica]|uniref:Sigma-70 family RNA polymerase sigma factor n=1 Tax=Aminipila butyrica TaxID=433296 RepID=A0A858BSP6_9FIRM|nr:sigma-70 family RNA polymerase sigma factor [Aminipila butyrica]QIB68098.1 sigma-70 family RNA polymerase sigma factor [Aminipila butyrica]
MNESELIINIQQGDREAFGTLFRLYEAKALRTAFLITGNQAMAEDLVQEAFVKCYCEIGKLKNPESFKPWFYRLLVRMGWKQTRQEKKYVPVPTFEDRKQIGQAVSCEQTYLENEFSEILYSEIQKLEQKKRTTVLLYYYSELSVKEIAQVMGCLEGTVKSRLHTSRRTLKASLENLKIKEDGYYGKTGYEAGL